MAIRSIDDLRKQAGEAWANDSDEDLISAYSRSLDLDPAQVANQLGYKAEERSVSGNRFSAAIDNYQAGLYGVGEAVTGALGFTGAEETLAARRRANELEANVNLGRAREQGAIESYKDVKSLSDAGSYMAGLAIQSAPYAAEALVGGIGGRALMGGTRAALGAAAGDVAAETAARQALTRGSQIGAATASYPSAVGDVLQNQREQAGTTDVGSAIALGVPYAALNVLGVEGALAKGQAFRSAGSLLDDISGFKGAAARTGVTGVKTGAAESFSETAQEGLNQFGRMAVDPNERFASPEAMERFKESAVGGFVLGGAAGSLGGGWRRSEGSFLPGSTTGGETDVSNKPDNNAINKAIDEEGTPLPSTSTQVDQVRQQQEVQLEQARVQAQQQVQQESVQVAQQQAQEQAQQQQQAFMESAKTFGVVPAQRPGQFSIAGKLLFTPQDAAVFMEQLDQLNASKTPEQKAILGSVLSSGVVKVKPDANVKSVSTAANKFLDGFGLSSASTKVEAADRANTIINTVDGPKALKQAEQLNEFYRAVTGTDAPAFVSLQQQIGEQEASKQTKGASNEQLQNNARVREVPEQGGTTQASGTGTGDVRPASVQPVGTAGIGAGSLGLQTGAVPSQGVSTGAGASGSGISVSSTGTQAQGQVNEAQLTGTDQEGRGGLSGQAVERNRTPEQQAEEVATNLVESVIKGVINAVVVRKGRMSKENLAKLKDFIYYDASQIESQKQGLPGLSKKELAEMFEVSTDVIDGWQDISRNFFEQNRGVIQAQIYKALDENGLTLLELKEAVQARRDVVETDAVILEEGQLAEVEREDEEAAKQEVTETAAADQELTEVDESQLDQRDLSAEDSGMTVMTGRKGISVQEQNKPEETVNAQIKKALEQYSKAVNEGNEQLEAELTKKIDKLTAEAKRLNDLIVAKGEAKSAPQKPSAKKKAPAKEKAEAVTESKAQTEEELAAEAWDRVAKRYPEAPAFADLTKEQKADWVSYGKENWTSDDVQTELVKLAKQELRSPAQSVQKVFSETNPLIDPLSEEVDAALRGKTIQQAMNWALSKTRNEYERSVLRAVDARLKELTNLGVEFSFQLTKEGKQLTGGASGISIYTPAGLGQAQKIDVILNGAHTGEKAGTSYEILAHELIHAVTQAQLKFYPEGSGAKELRELYKEVVAHFNKRAKAGTLTDFEKTIFKGETNKLENPDELLAWGLTNKDFQEYLASIQVTPKETLWNKFVKLISNLLDSPVRADSALGRLMAISENMLNESIDPYVKEANKRFQSLGKQANTTPWPTWSLNADHGAPVWVDGDYALYKAESVTGATIYLPGKRANDTSAVAKVDIGSFTGNLPADVVTEMKSVASSLRPTTSAAKGTSTVTKQVDKLREQAKSNIDKIPASIRGPFRAIHDALFSAKETALSVMLTIDVVRMAKKYMKSAEAWYDVNSQRTAIETAITEKLDKILVTAQDELNAADRKVVNRLIEDSTIANKWAFDPNLPGVTDKNIDPELAARFNAIGNPKAKQVIRDVFKFWNETLQQEQEALRTEIDNTFADRLAYATETEKKDIEKRKKETLDKFSSILEAKATNPYAPLKRYGPFVVVAKSQEYIDAEKNLDSKRVKELEGDEKHYVVEFAETSSEAEAMYDSLKKLGYDFVEKPFKKSESKDHLYSSIDLYKAFTQLKKTISAERAATSSEEQEALYKTMNELVDELYLSSLAESSARKSELQRKGVAGLNRALSGQEARDMLRATFSQGAAKAKHIANLKTNDASLKAMVAMQKEAQENRAEAYPYLNELIAREAQALQVRERSMLDGINRMSGDWFLTFSPGFYFQQSAQTYVLSVPWLAGKANGNYGKAFGAVTTAYKDIMPLVKGTKLREHLDFSKAPKDVREMLENLVARGAINIGIESELLSHRSIDENVVTATYSKVTNKLRGGINRIEALNRATAATAAYRLEMAKSGKKDLAMEAAFEVVKETHGLYDGSNAPRLFNKNAFTRSIFQFRRFQIIQLTTLARIMKDAVAGAGPLEKSIARKQFAFMVGHSLALAGVKGLPLYGLASLAYTLGKAAFGDEDDPKDFEAWLRTQGGLLLARGIPAFMGVDVSGKLGQGNVTSVLPYTDIDLTSRGGIEKLVIGVAGPFVGGLLPKMADGAGLMLGGQYYKGLEQVLPNGFGGVMKGARFTTEGVTTRRGDLVMSPDELSFADGMMQALGLPTSKLSERQYLQGQLIKTDQFYNDKATEIKGSYTRAVKEGDAEAKREAQDAWKSLQVSRKENGYTVQPLSTLLKAPQEQKKRERNTVGGVAVTKSNKGFAQRTSEQ